MTTPDTTHKTIFVVIRDLGAAERDYLTGVFRFVNTQANWSIKLYNDRAGLEGVLSDRAASDGILAVLPHRSDAKAALWFGDVPTVLVDIPPHEEEIADVIGARGRPRGGMRLLVARRLHALLHTARRRLAQGLAEGHMKR